MLVRLIENKVRVFIDKFLHGILDELVERVQLLPHETLLIEEA